MFRRHGLAGLPVVRYGHHELHHGGGVLGRFRLALGLFHRLQDESTLVAQDRNRVQARFIEHIAGAAVEVGRGEDLVLKQGLSPSCTLYVTGCN